MHGFGRGRPLHHRPGRIRPDRRPNERAACRSREIPPIVFSEAMRDVDLFVGVTSIGADTNWQSMAG